jgi:glycosyltransferase involved in cell wall biosynthesis
MTRVLHIVPTLDPAFGGPSHSVPALCARLAENGVQVELWTTDWGEPVPVEGQIPVRSFASRPFAGWVKLPRSRALEEAVRSEAGGFDVVHVHSLWNPVASLVLRGLRKRGAAYCISPRGMLDPVVLRRGWVRKRLWELAWERANVEQAGFIHFTARKEEAKARQSGWTLPRTVVSANPIDLASWPARPRLRVEAWAASQCSEVVGFVGRLSWAKNLDLLIEAVALLRERGRDVGLLLAGPDQEGIRPRLQELARQRGLEPFTTFAGMLRGEALREAYAASSCIALVSVKENFGIAAAQGLASGRVVVLSEGVDMAGDLPPSPAVQVVAPTPGAIADGLSRALARAEAVGLPDPKARELAETSWGDRSLDRLVESYRAII